MLSVLLSAGRSQGRRAAAAANDEDDDDNWDSDDSFQD